MRLFGSFTALLMLAGSAAADKWEGSIKVEGMKTKAEIAKMVKITFAEAEKAALAAVKGESAAKRIYEISAKVKKGFLILEVEIYVEGQMGKYEVRIDAGNGKVLDVDQDDGI